MRMNKFISIKEFTNYLHKGQINDCFHLEIVTTGFKQLDEFTYDGGVMPSELVIINGHPAMGI